VGDEVLDVGDDDGRGLYRRSSPARIDGGHGG
jgi:hypothetical protein